MCCFLKCQRWAKVLFIYMFVYAAPALAWVLGRIQRREGETPQQAEQCRLLSGLRHCKGGLVLCARGSWEDFLEERRVGLEEGGARGKGM